MRNRRTTQRTNRHLNLTAIITMMVLGLMLFSGLLTYSLTSNPERQQIAIEEAKAVQPWKIASRVTGYILGGIALKAGLYVLVGFGVYYAMRIGLNWLDTRARLIKAENGLYPLIRVSNNQYYDANRSMGESPLITGMALEVQRNAALASSPNLTVKVTSKPAQLPKADDMPMLEQAVNLPDMVRLADVARSPSLTNLVLGQSEQGTITASLYDLMHVLAVGASGFGKSAFLRALVWQLAQVHDPVSIVGIDCFGSELNVISDWAKLLFPVAKELPEAAYTLHAVTDEIKRRKELYAGYPQAYDLPSYNRLASEPLEPIVMLVDEGTAMLNENGVADPLRQVVQTARQFGVYALLAGQNVNHKVMPTQMRDNFSTRLCFHTSKSSRHVVLGETPDDVTAKGRAWAQRPGETLQLIQCPYVTRQEVQQVLEVGAPQKTIDVEAVMPVTEADDKEQQIMALFNDGGLSDSKIARQVYGYSNARTVEHVKELRRRRQNDYVQA